MNFIDKMKAEFINGRTKFDWCFLGLGLLIQTIAIIYGYMTGTPDGLISIICSIAGVISVVLCAQGKISFYLFAYILAALFCVVSIICFSETIDLYHTRCPTCDVICLDDYCSTCGFSMNPSFECSCGSSYDLDSLPNFCSECGSPIRSD